MPTDVTWWLGCPRLARGTLLDLQVGWVGWSQIHASILWCLKTWRTLKLLSKTRMQRCWRREWILCEKKVWIESTWFNTVSIVLRCIGSSAMFMIATVLSVRDRSRADSSTVQTLWAEWMGFIDVSTGPHASNVDRQGLIAQIGCIFLPGRGSKWAQNQLRPWCWWLWYTDTNIEAIYRLIIMIWY